MEYIGVISRAVYDILNLPLSLYGFQLTFWQIFVYSTVAFAVLGFLWEAFWGD